jgi:hypothetical protein
MGIPVPAGENVIDLKFFPHRMGWGILLSFAGLCGLILMHVLAAYIAAVLKQNREEEEADLGFAVSDPRVRDDYDGLDPDFAASLESLKQESKNFDFNN